MLLAPFGRFSSLAGLVWVSASVRTEQVEPPEQCTTLAVRGRQNETMRGPFFLLAAFDDNHGRSRLFFWAVHLSWPYRDATRKPRWGLAIRMTGLGGHVPLNHLIYKGVLAPVPGPWAGQA